MKITKFRRRQSLWLKIKSKFGRKQKKRFGFLKLFLISGLSVLGGLFIYGAFFLPDVRDADQLNFAQSTIIYDRNALEKIRVNPHADLTENILYTIHGDENRDYIPLEEISPWMAKATVAIEDDRFYRHFGFDVFGLVNAVLGQLGLVPPRGGSTITQQLVKNTFLTREKTFTRKFKEILLSIKMEWHYTKDEILELYLNKIPYGSNAHGIESASKTFFGKSARDLTLAEATILAGLPQAPSRYNPYGSNRDQLMGYYDYNAETGERVLKKGRKDLVLKRMLDLKMITYKEFAKAFGDAQDLEFKRANSDIGAPHFVFFIMEKLEEKYGKEFLRQGGLQIFTTIDPDLQNLAKKIIDEKSAHYEGTYGASNVALLGIKNETGEILTYLGGKNFDDEEHDGQVDVLTSERQPGSSFKPFVYAAAFMKGYSPASVLFDVETDFGGYIPQNFDGSFMGPVSARESLNRSLNIPAVKMAYLAGLDEIYNFAKMAGIKMSGDVKQQGLSLGLGVGEVQPLSHINAYQVFAGDGSYYDPTAILEIRNANGKILETADLKAKKHDGIDPEVAAMVRNILTDEGSRPTTDGFDWNKLLQLEGHNNGAKTGTSNRTAKNPEFNPDEPEDEETNPKMILAPGDSWTIGFTPHMVAGVWVGNNRGKPMKSGATGMSVAAPLWKAFMMEGHEILFKKGADREKLYNEPIPLTPKMINKFSGKLVKEDTPESLRIEEYFSKANIPTELDDSIKEIEIDKISGKKATKFTPEFAKIKKQVLDIKSVRSDLPRWQSPVDYWLKTHAKFLTSLGTIFDEVEDEPVVEEEDGGRKLSFRDRFTDRQDDVHNNFTQKNPPKVAIISPLNQGIIAPGTVEIKVAADAKFGIKIVEFYFDDQLVEDRSRPPYTGRFTLPKTIKQGSSHTIRVVAVDRLLNYAEKEITVKVEADTVGPDIKFLGPVGNQKIPLNSEIQILADIKDVSSAVRSVDFFLDEELIETVTRAPFRTGFVATGKLGRHFLSITAMDEHGNVSEKSLPVVFERERLITETAARIDKITKYRNSTSVEILFPSPKNIEYAIFIIKKDNAIVFSEKWENLPKLKQVQISHDIFSGKLELFLSTKTRGEKKETITPAKTLNL